MWRKRRPTQKSNQVFVVFRCLCQLSPLRLDDLLPFALHHSEALSHLPLHAGRQPACGRKEDAEGKNGLPPEALLHGRGQEPCKSLVKRGIAAFFRVERVEVVSEAGQANDVERDALGRC